MRPHQIYRTTGNYRKPRFSVKIVRPVNKNHNLQPKKAPRLTVFSRMDITKAAHFVQKPLRLFRIHTLKNRLGTESLAKNTQAFPLGVNPQTPKVFRLRYGRNALRLPSLGCCEIFFGSDLKNFYATKIKERLLLIFRLP